MEEVNENSQSSQDTSEQAGTEQNAPEQNQTNNETNKDACKWAMLCHIAGLAGYVIPVVGNIVGPLVLWQLKKDEHPFIDEQGKEAVNFQISMAIYALVSVALFALCIGPFLLAAVGIIDLVLLIVAAVKANDGQHYRYPLTIRLIK
ncbi:MAG: DUF4870 domain-containing protein [Planctomycetes bacterium]|nr:DUF4870 domain-containing protein [Planctomycetota bacterium]